MRLRYRVDGVLLDAMPPPKQMQLALASRFKIMSSLALPNAACRRTAACGSA